MLSKIKAFFRSWCGERAQAPPSTRHPKPPETPPVPPHKLGSQRKSIIQGPSDTQKQQMSSVGTTIVEFVKIAMATLLSIFVPQYCEESGTTCTLAENFSNLTRFNEFVIFMNFLSLGFFIKLLLVINKREAYFISHLEETRSEPYNSFPENLAPYPRIMIRVKEHNARLKTWTHATLWIFGLNVLFSAILIYNYFYDGFRSISTLLANVLLVSSKLYSLYTTAEDCNQYRPLALSCVQLTPVSYNTVDDNYAIVPQSNGHKQYRLRISIDDGKPQQHRRKKPPMKSKSAPRG